MKITIIDPSSTEFNRGSFCYGPYLLYNGLTEQGHTVRLMETFQPEELDSIPTDSDMNIVMLWSYPQVEACLLLARMLPKEKTFFAGYSPMVEWLGLTHLGMYFGVDLLQHEEFLLTAMKAYPKYYSHFSRLLLSDCDMHIKAKASTDLVYPLFTTYGCPMGCSFCPSTVNCGHKRTIIPTNDVWRMLQQCLDRQIKYLHFTDEDFFYDISRTYDVLQFMRGKGFHAIALSSVKKLWQFIRTYSPDILSEAGIELIEVGFESADTRILAGMGVAKSVALCRQVAEAFEAQQLPTRLFWLVQTFFPGETIRSLNETGQFMGRYGCEMDEVVGRLRTNGTKGGLGQFFQPYHGTKLLPSLSDGMYLTARPIRLVPGYIPKSFMEDIVRNVHMEKFDLAKPWLDLYHVRVEELPLIGMPLKSYFQGYKTVQKMDNAIMLAILARMGVIE